MSDVCGFEVLADGPQVRFGTLPALAIRNGIRYCRVTTTAPADPDDREAHLEAQRTARRAADLRGDSPTIWAVVPCSSHEDFLRLAEAGPVGVILVPSPYFLEECFLPDQIHCQLSPTADSPGWFDCESPSPAAAEAMAERARQACESARQHDQASQQSCENGSRPMTFAERSAMMRRISIEHGANPEEYDALTRRLSARRDDADVQIFFPESVHPPEP